MKKVEYIEIIKDNNLESYEVSYDPAEMYYFYKTYENLDSEQVKFEVTLSEEIIENSDLTLYIPVDEIIECEKNVIKEDNLYKVHGIGIKISPFIKTISSENNYKGLNLINGFRDNIININNFLLEKNSMNMDRKRLLVNYYFGLFESRLINAMDINVFESYKNTDEYQNWLMDIYETSDAIKNIESNKIKVLRYDSAK